MKKSRAIILALSMLIALCAGCGDSNKPTGESQPVAQEGEPSEDPNSGAGGAEIALICSAGGGSINDRGFFQSTYEGIQEFCEETGHTYTYYDTAENTIDSLYESIDLAVLNGAKVICTSGGDFVGMMEELYAAYPDLYFICNETPYTTPGENAVIYTFQAQDSAFLAGVAAVVEGYTDIGFVGGIPVLPVMRAGYGFIQGVNWAAGELGVEGIQLKYWYSNSFEPSADIQAYAAAWFESGTELIAAFCGGAAPSVWAAAEASDGLCFGCDVDQYYESDTIITSVLKNVDVSTKEALWGWENGEFPGGETISYGMADGGVDLAMAHSLMESFTEEEYEHYRDLYINELSENVYSVEDFESADDMWEALGEHNIELQIYE